MHGLKAGGFHCSDASRWKSLCGVLSPQHGRRLQQKQKHKAKSKLCPRKLYEVVGHPECSIHKLTSVGCSSLSVAVHTTVAVLLSCCVQADAFSSESTLRLLGGLLAPYCSMLTYSTRLTEMRRLVNDIIAPIAAQLAQQKHSQLAKLGCTVEEAPPGSVAADGKGISVAVGSQGRSSSSSDATAAQADAAGYSTANGSMQPVAPVASSGGSLRQRKGHSSSKSSAAGSGSGKGSSSNKASAAAAAGAITQCISEAQHAQGLSHKRFESGVCCQVCWRVWLSACEFAAHVCM